MPGFARPVHEVTTEEGCSPCVLYACDGWHGRIPFAVCKWPGSLSLSLSLASEPGLSASVSDWPLSSTQGPARPISDCPPGLTTAPSRTVPLFPSLGPGLDAGHSVVAHSVHVVAHYHSPPRRRLGTNRGTDTRQEQTEGRTLDKNRGTDTDKNKQRDGHSTRTIMRYTLRRTNTGSMPSSAWVDDEQISTTAMLGTSFNHARSHGYSGNSHTHRPFNGTETLTQALSISSDSDEEDHLFTRVQLLGDKKARNSRGKRFRASRAPALSMSSRTLYMDDYGQHTQDSSSAPSISQLRHRATTHLPTVAWVSG